MKTLETIGAILIALVSFVVAVWWALGGNKSRTAPEKQTIHSKEEAVEVLAALGIKALTQVRGKPESFLCGLVIVAVDKDNKPDNWAGDDKDAVAAILVGPGEVEGLRRIFESVAPQATAAGSGSPSPGPGLPPPPGSTIWPQ